MPTRQAEIGLSLFDLEADIGETTDVKYRYPDIVSRMTELADSMREDLGDSAQKIKGAGVRSAGRLN